MSLKVELPALKERVAEYGAAAFLVTVTVEATPHLASVVVAWDGDRLVVGAGGRSRASAGVHPTVSLLWPPGPDPAYSLIVDGTVVSVSADAEMITIEPTSAVLHRVAGAAGDGPNCRPVSG